MKIRIGRRVRARIRWYFSLEGAILIAAVVSWVVGYFVGYGQYLYPLAVVCLALLFPQLLLAARATGGTGGEPDEGARRSKPRRGLDAELHSKVDDNRIHMIRYLDGIRNDLLNILRSDRVAWRHTAAELAARLSELESRGESFQSANDPRHSSAASIEATLHRSDSEQRNIPNANSESLTSGEEHIRGTANGLLSIVARSTAGPLPEELVLLVSTPMSGGTRLLDQLRTHPLIEMYPGFDFYDTLRLRGRRYPTRMQEARNHPAIAIEARPGDGQLIADNRCGVETVRRVRALGLSRFAIERIQPTFFDFDVDRLSSRVFALEQSGTKIHVIYLVRDPKAAVKSFLSHRPHEAMRCPDMDTNDVINLYAKSYRAIQELKLKLPGRVFDNSQMIGSTSAICTVYRDLWGPGHDALWSRVAMECEGVTIRGSDESGSHGFLGERTEPTPAAQAHFRDLIEEYPSQVSECEARYADILGGPGVSMTSRPDASAA